MKVGYSLRGCREHCHADLRFLSSRHSANCKPIVALSLCACVEDLTENRNICCAVYGVV